MPALKKTLLPTSYASIISGEERLALEKRANGRSRDCTVVAMSIVTGLSYATCHKALEEAGRKNGRGTYFAQQKAAYEALGFTVREWTSREVVDLIMSYPKKGIAGLTTHQPRRFAKAWAPHRDKALLLYSRGHVSACVGGVVQDWAINRAKQLYMVVEVTKA
jgi:hypothetical protein